MKTTPFPALILVMVCAFCAQAGEPVLSSSQPATAPAADAQATPCPEAGWLDFCRGFQKDIQEKYATKVGVLSTYVGQTAINGPGHHTESKGTFMYRLGIEQGLWSGAALIAMPEGGSGQGVDPFLGDILGTNGAGGEPDWIYLPRLYLQQSMLEDKILLAGGRIDMTDFFDTNAVANCPYSQFLSNSLVNNPTIPFPEAGWAAVAKITPTDWVYAQAGVSDAQAVATQTGFKTAFHGADDSFSAFELGLTPKIAERQGNYRFLFWYDSQPLERIGAESFKRDDSGFAMSFDQEITDRITLFARYGFAHQDVRPISNFWSVGGQLAKPLPGRDCDVWGVAVGQAIMGQPARREDNLGSSETLLETYYAIKITDYFTISPDLQVILNPAASNANDVAVVLGLRATISF